MLLLYDILGWFAFVFLSWGGVAVGGGRGYRQMRRTKGCGPLHRLWKRGEKERRERKIDGSMFLRVWCEIYTTGWSWPKTTDFLLLLLYIPYHILL
ncbi:hypothetical protein J3F83DRAFT_746517 [Trichoderma novae-zelandiae]